MSALFELHKAVHQCAMEQASAIFYGLWVLAIGAVVASIIFFWTRREDRRQAERIATEMRRIAEFAVAGRPMTRTWSAEALDALVTS